jgi:hypothetical protein
MNDSAAPFPEPTITQTTAFDFLLSKQHEIEVSVLEALLPFYSERRPDYKEFLGRDFKLLMPKVDDIALFRELMQPGIVYLHSVEKNQMAYTGLSFGTSWEVEHGLGFFLHGSRVVKVGDAETAFGSL